MPRMQLLLHRVWPLRTPSLSERFPLRPRGSLIFGGVRATFFFLKKKSFAQPHFSKPVFSSLPSASASASPLHPPRAPHLLFFSLRFALGVSTSLPRRQASTTQVFVSVTYPFPITGKAGSIHLPSVITNTTEVKCMYMMLACVCRCMCVFLYTHMFT